jgi:DNA-directed RNA polymerase subunit RPC12/RpoP
VSLKAQQDRNLVFVLIGTPGIDLFRSPIHGVMMMMMIYICPATQGMYVSMYARCTHLSHKILYMLQEVGSVEPLTMLHGDLRACQHYQHG